MSKTIYETKKMKDHNKPLIPNAQLENMFLSFATENQMKEYNILIDKGLTHTATAYASHKVSRTFSYLRDFFIKNGGDMDFLQYQLWNK